MNKRDLAVILLLIGLMIAWPVLYKKFFPSETPQQEAPERFVQEPIPDQQPLKTSVSPLQQELKTETVAPVVSPEQAIALLKEESAKPVKPEQKLFLTNAFLTATVSSWGGGIVSVELYRYRQTVEEDSSPVVLDFSDKPALTYSRLPGFSSMDDFEVVMEESGSVMRIGKTNSKGLRLTRTISLGENYQFNVQDILSNEGNRPLSVPDHYAQVGPMRKDKTETKMRGQKYLGIDVLLSSAGEGITYWARKLPKLFKSEMKENNLQRLPEAINKIESTPIDWLAAKSKFFVQILAPDGGGSGYIMHAERSLLPGERTDPDVKPKSADIDSVSASVIFSGTVLEPGESITRDMSYYAGPKELSILKKLGLHQEDVMDFGWWSPVCKILLSVLNATYSVVPNYGVAIILLTILIRIIFWPLTHKSTHSMKKMQELQPQIKELRSKYKDSPKKLQEETMALYKKNKVNPMSGCLPMLIQIPVFIALFVVLRSAIELRFAPFLWIRDLSEPERLFANILPIPLNILPIFMAATMFWQQKLMPSTDPNQQKIMAVFMPIMMLVMFYMMPSALVLYWSASQCIMIAQQLMQKKRSDMKPA